MQVRITVFYFASIVVSIFNLYILHTHIFAHEPKKRHFGSARLTQGNIIYKRERKSKKIT